jgi:hypothetical protein
MALFSEGKTCDPEDCLPAHSGHLSRGSDQASYPTKPLGSYLRFGPAMLVLHQSEISDGLGRCAEDGGAGALSRRAEWHIDPHRIGELKGIVSGVNGSPSRC